MTHPTPEDPLAALREEIGRAGQTTQALRIGACAGLAWVVSDGLLRFAIYVAEQRTQVVGFSPWHFNPIPEFTPWLMLPVSLRIGAACAVAFAVAACYRAMRLRRLRGRLAELTGSGRSHLLLPLRHERGDTRRIVRALLHDLAIPTELTPARPSEGSGAEVSGVEG